MDAVELPLPLPVDVAPTPKLMGSEGFVSHPNSIDCCNSRLLQNDVANIKTAAEFPSCNKFVESQLSKSSSQLPHIKGEELSKNMSNVNGKNCPVITSGLEGVSLHRKAAKSNRSNSSCSKRPRISQSEDSTSPNAIEESKDISDKLDSYNLKCTSPEKSQLPKQKSNTNKRGDKRNFKVPSAKAKFESSMKMGASIFSSTSGGNNFFGLYGLKHDFHDITKLMDEQPLDELLKGTFVRPNLGKDKGKKTLNMSENFLNSFRKSCSILQSPKPVQSQNMTDMDYSSNVKISTCQFSSICAVESIGNGDKEQSCTTDMPSSQKDPCSETEYAASPLDSPLRQPKDILEQIVLHPFRDLESLLLDVSKPATTPKNSNDQRSGKQISRRPSLASFPWSHAFGGHSRTNSETVKLSTSRSMCQGKWTRIGVIACSTDMDRSCFTNLDSFSYDQSLVPSFGSSDKKHFPSLFADLPFHQLNSSSSSVPCSEDTQVKAEFGGQVDNKENDERCPRILTAAQTLCEIASRATRQSSDGILRWQRKTSHKAMKAWYFKSNEKVEEMSSRPISTVGSDMVAKSVEQIMPSKKPRLSIVENKANGHSHNVKKGPYVWPSSKSSRSFPSKHVRDSFVENKRTNASILKQHCMMPPPARDMERAYDGQQQAGKLVVMDWKRGRDNTD